MPHRAGLDTQRVVETAAELIDAEGVDALTLATLAEHLHVRIPSLYNHISGLDGQIRRAGGPRDVQRLSRLRQGAPGLYKYSE